MIETKFLSVYSFYCSFILSFMLCIWPFGIRVVLKYCCGEYGNQSNWETLFPYFIVLLCVTLLNMYRLWCSQCEPMCIFFITGQLFEECCKNI